MKGLSLRQPWAWAIPHGKGLENRGWAFLAKGMGNLPTERIAIHASSTKPTYGDVKGVYEALLPEYEDPTHSLPPEALLGGNIVATCRIAGVVRCTSHTIIGGTQEWPKFELRADDRAMLVGLLGEAAAVQQVARWWIGPFALVLVDVLAVPKLIPCSGRQMFWHVPSDVVAQIPASQR